MYIHKKIVKCIKIFLIHSNVNQKSIIYMKCATLL